MTEDEDLAAWLRKEKTDEEQLEEASQALLAMPKQQQFALMLYLTKKPTPVIETRLFTKWAHAHQDLEI
jgi:hypothetical protein